LYIWRLTLRKSNNQNNVGLKMERPETAGNSVVAMETQVLYRIYQDGNTRFSVQYLLQLFWVQNNYTKYDV
jgi:hypothetical protein